MARPRSIPRAHPLVRTLFSRINETDADYENVASRAGLGSGTMRNWRKGHEPLVSNLDAALNTVGLKLYVGPMEERKI